MGVHQANGLEHHVDRDDHDDGRQDALGNDPEQDVAIAKGAVKCLPKARTSKKKTASPTALEDHQGRRHSVTAMTSKGNENQDDPSFGLY